MTGSVQIKRETRESSFNRDSGCSCESEGFFSYFIVLKGVNTGELRGDRKNHLN